ncbi:MAG: BrnT family toxin [Candidatus Methylomirabilales bacterium]
MRVERFDWDEDNIEHIARHGVLPEEVEEVFDFGPYLRKAKGGLYAAYGQTDAGRHLVVFFRYRAKGVIRVITARQMTGRERSLYRKRDK